MPVAHTYTCYDAMTERREQQRPAYDAPVLQSMLGHRYGAPTLGHRYGKDGRWHADLPNLLPQTLSHTVLQCLAHSLVWPLGRIH